MLPADWAAPAPDMRSRQFVHQYLKGTVFESSHAPSPLKHKRTLFEPEEIAKAQLDQSVDFPPHLIYYAGEGWASYNQRGVA